MMHASYDQDTSDDDDTDDAEENTDDDADDDTDDDDDYDGNLKTCDHNTSYDDDDDEKAEVPWPTSALRRKSCRHSDHSYLILPMMINSYLILPT